jgi:hypothetical protein
MWASTNEQGYGCTPGRHWLHKGDAVPVLDFPSWRNLLQFLFYFSTVYVGIGRMSIFTYFMQSLSYWKIMGI